MYKFNISNFEPSSIIPNSQQKKARATGKRYKTKAIKEEEKLNEEQEAKPTEEVVTVVTENSTKDNNPSPEETSSPEIKEELQQQIKEEPIKAKEAIGEVAPDYKKIKQDFYLNLLNQQKMLQENQAKMYNEFSQIKAEIDKKDKMLNDKVKSIDSYNNINNLMMTAQKNFFSN